MTNRQTSPPTEKKHQERVQVEIFGQRYNIVGGENPERILEISSYVDNQMREISTQNRGMSALKVAILTALNITDQLLQFHEKNSTFIQRGEQMISQLKNVVEED